ncbi:Proteasome assembly chaperone 2 [Leucoagaricus sp. SymC.cos]|nr:Proteasome assembly chaperone 2 [Leucoagaricus sp. SymC.cos]
MTFIYPSEDIEYTGKVLLVPIVSTANVSQLAVDLIIATLALERVGVVDPGYFVPVAGGREDREPGITTALELYGKPEIGILVLQQRSPVLKSRKEDFVTAIIDFIESSKFACAVFLTGVDVLNRTDAQMLTPTYQILPPNGPSLVQTPLANLLSLKIPDYTSPVQQHTQPHEQIEREEGAIPFMPGGGLTRRILTSIPRNWSIPTAAILQFVMEGDNRADASLLAAVIARILSLDSKFQEWRQPGSWQQGLFGAPHDQTLYG